MDGIVCGAFLGDKAFDTNKVREFLAKTKTEAVTPARKGTTGGADYDKEKYKWRHLIENFFCRIKAFRRIATRDQKTDACFSAMINLVNI
jgi:transposase